MKPQIAIRVATTRATHETDIDIECGPICTSHRLISLTACRSATIAKISAVIAV